MFKTLIEDFVQKYAVIAESEQKILLEVPAPDGSIMDFMNLVEPFAPKEHNIHFAEIFSGESSNTLEKIVFSPFGVEIIQKCRVKAYPKFSGFTESGIHESLLLNIYVVSKNDPDKVLENYSVIFSPDEFWFNDNVNDQGFYSDRLVPKQKATVTPPSEPMYFCPNAVPANA